MADPERGSRGMKPVKKDPGAGGPRCPFCGRRNTVRRIDEKLCFCSHCDKMFQG